LDGNIAGREAGRGLFAMAALGVKAERALPQGHARERAGGAQSAPLTSQPASKEDLCDG